MAERFLDELSDLNGRQLERDQVLYSVSGFDKERIQWTKLFEYEAYQPRAQFEHFKSHQNDECVF